MSSFFSSRWGILLSLLLVMFCAYIDLLDPLLTRLGVTTPSSEGSSLLAILAIPLALLMIWLIWWLKRGRAAELGLAWPASWPKTLLLSLLVVAVAKGVGELVPVVSQLLGGAPPDVSQVDSVQASLPQLMVWLTISWTSAAFGEEIIWRGFLIGQLAKLFNETRWAWITALLFSSLVFGLLHVQQGVSGMVSTGLIGLVFGTAYLVFRRNLWIAILAHGITNSISLLMVYFGMG